MKKSIHIAIPNDLWIGKELKSLACFSIDSFKYFDVDNCIFIAKKILMNFGFLQYINLLLKISHSL
jgi:hypothetical protein